jgi:hypothetical protein
MSASATFSRGRPMMFLARVSEGRAPAQPRVLALGRFERLCLIVSERVRNVSGTGQADTRPGDKRRGIERVRLTGRRPVWLALEVSASLVVLIAAVPLAALTHQLNGSNVSVLLLTAPFAAVGAILAGKRPANPIGWILLALGLLTLLSFDASMYALLRYRLGHGSLPFGSFAVFLAPDYVPLVLLLPLPIALFPAGRMPTRVWRATLWVYLGISLLWLSLLAGVQFDALLLHPIRVDRSGVAVLVDHPTGGWQTAQHISNICLIPYLLLAATWIARQIAAYRQAVGAARQQLKWLFTGGGLAIGGFLVNVIAGGKTGLAAAIIGDLGLVAISALPIGIVIGILRYRLYEIDRLISRTITYALLTAALAGVFAAVVLLMTRVLPFSSPVAVAASTLAAAALFTPLRARLQHLIDHRFNRAHYDAEAILAAFTGRLSTQVELDAIRTELLDTATLALAPTHASIWLRPSSPATDEGK